MSPETPPSLKVLISYRREDSAGYAGRLYDSLAERFGRDQVFIDIDAIEPGVDFTEVIAREVSSSDVVLVVIGPRWLSADDGRGGRRLDNPEDYHRLEVEAALERNIRVIPILVADAHMPGRDELPESIQKLAYRNALEMTDARWGYDAGRLIGALDRVAEAKAPEPEPEPEPVAPPPAAAPPPVPAAETGMWFPPPDAAPPPAYAPNLAAIAGPAPAPKPPRSVRLFGVSTLIGAVLIGIAPFLAWDTYFGDSGAEDGMWPLWVAAAFLAASAGLVLVRRRAGLWVSLAMFAVAGSAMGYVARAMTRNSDFGIGVWVAVAGLTALFVGMVRRWVFRPRSAG
jgi:hypothetical protein